MHPRSSQTVLRESVERKRRSWLMITSAVRRASRSRSPFDRGQVEMIGWFIEQQDIGQRRQHARELERGALRRRRDVQDLHGL